MGMDSFDSGGWMNNWGLNGAANPWAQTPQAPAAQPQAPAPAPAAAQTGDYGAMFGGLFGDYGGQGAVGTGSTRPEQYNPQPQAQTQAQAPDYNSMFGGMFGDYGGQGAATNTGTGSTRPEVYTGTGYNGNAAAGGAGGASAAGGTPASGPYRTPDWMRNSVLMLDQSPEAQRQFFAANPQYEEDWRRIQAGGNSAFSTDGSTLIRSDFNNMSPEAAAYYRENPDALLANEGFGHDPTLAYMNYYGGPASIGANNKTQNISSYLQQNRWTPNGVVGGANNPLMYANTAYGSGTAGYLNGRPGQPTPGAQGAGGTGAGGAGGSRPQTGGVYPQPYGSGGGYSGGSSGGGAGSSSSGMGSNPYLQQQADALTGTMTDNWRRNVQPQLASGAQLAGGYGGSRQGVIEANSANDLSQGIGAALANLYSSGYNADRSYDLGLKNNELGWGNLGLGYSNLDRNINNDNLGWQMQGAQFGLSLQDRLMNNNQIGLSTGTQINDNAYNNWNRFSQGAGSLGQGYGTTTGTSTTPGNVIGGALGGAQLGGRIGNWWGSGGGSDNSNFWSPNFSGSMGD